MRFGADHALVQVAALLGASADELLGMKEPARSEQQRQRN